MYKKIMDIKYRYIYYLIKYKRLILDTTIVIYTKLKIAKTALFNQYSDVIRTNLNCLWFNPL